MRSMCRIRARFPTDSSSYTDASSASRTCHASAASTPTCLQRHARQLHLNGYGAPFSFNSVDSVDIVKGPASVQGGPGAGVGGAIDSPPRCPRSSGRLPISAWSSTRSRSAVRPSMSARRSIPASPRASPSPRTTAAAILRHVFPPAVAVASLIDQVTPSYSCWSPAASRTRHIAKTTVSIASISNSSTMALI